MKELNPKEPKTELSVDKQQEKKETLVGQILPHPGHTLFEINLGTKEIKPAKFETELVLDLNSKDNFNKKVIINKDCVYISALNRANVVKKLLKGSNGSRL